VAEPGQPLGARERCQRSIQGRRQHLPGVAVDHVVDPALALGAFRHLSTDQVVPPRQLARVCSVHRPSSLRDHVRGTAGTGPDGHTARPRERKRLLTADVTAVMRDDRSSTPAADGELNGSS
jgi:hypothetical protein